MNASGIEAGLVLTSLLTVFLGTTGAQSVIAVDRLSTPVTVIDMDAVGPVGPTTLAALNAAGTAGDARLASLQLTGLTGSAVYDTVTARGRALVPGPVGGLALVDPGASYEPFALRVDLGLPCVEFGIAVGDFAGSSHFEFRLGGTLIATFASVSGDAARLLRMEGAVFDRVDVRTEPAGSGFVVQELHVQNTAYWSTVGSGCARASSEELTLVMSGRLTAPLHPDFYLRPVSSADAAILAIGVSGTSFPGLGALPFDLGPYGAPGCFVRCDIALTDAVPTGGAGHVGYNLAQSSGLTGVAIHAQGYVLEFGANALGLVTSNSVVFVMQ